MVGEGQDCYMGSKMDTTMWFFSSRWGQSWLGPCPLSTPRLHEFGLIRAIHSISTLPMSHCKYNEWLCKVEIWIHTPQPSPYPGFWVEGGDDSGSSTLRFTPRWSIFGLFLEFHSISTLPTSHYKYNKWLEKVKIAIWHLKWTSQCVFESWLGLQLAWLHSTFDANIEWFWTDSGNSQHLNPSNVSL